MPSMDIESLAAAGQVGNADWIEPAGNGLAETAFPRKKAFFNRAEAVAVLIKVGIDTFLFPGRAGNHRSDDVSLYVNIKESLLSHDIPTFLLHQRRIDGIIPLQCLNLGLVHRRSAVTVHTATALAFLIIASEILGNHILGNEDISNLNYCSKRVFCHFTYC